MTTLDLLVALACAVGIVGTLFPVLPGAFLCAGAVALWGGFTGGATGWGVAVAAVVLVLIAFGLKYLIPARWLKDGGVPNWVLLLGGIGGIVGFFFLPIVGLIVGFIAGIFVAELIRLRSLGKAWPTTWTAMKAAGLSTLIDFASAVFITAIWVAALFLV